MLGGRFRRANLVNDLKAVRVCLSNSRLIDYNPVIAQVIGLGERLDRSINGDCPVNRLRS